MKKLFFATLLLLVSLPLIAQEKASTAVSATTVVVVTGVGVDADKALRNAFRNAVEQAVGLVVDAETVVKNEDVIKDQILSYSDGYVEKFDRIKEGKRDDGLYEIKIQATVKRRQLIEKLKEVKISVGKVEGESLFAEVVTQLDAEKNAAKLLEKALDGLPTSLLLVSAADKKPKIESKDDNNVTAYWTILVSYDNKRYHDVVLPKLLRTLADISKQKGEREALSAGIFYDVQKDNPMLVTPGYRTPFWPDTGIAFPHGFQFDKNNDLIVAISSGQNKNGDNRRWSWYVIDRSTCLPVLEKLAGVSPRLRISFLDGQNEVVHEEVVDLNKRLRIIDEDSGSSAKMPEKFKHPVQLQTGGQAGRVVTCDNSGFMFGDFPYLVRFANFNSTAADGRLFSDPNINHHPDIQSEYASLFTQFIVAPFFVLNPLLPPTRADGGPYYGDRLEITYETRFSLNVLKRIVAIKCSFVESVGR